MYRDHLTCWVCERRYFILFSLRHSYTGLRVVAYLRTGLNGSAANGSVATLTISKQLR